MTTLHSWRREPLSLAVAVSECTVLLKAQEGQVVGLAYSPDHCVFVELSDGVLLTHGARTDRVVLAHDDVFECRLFSAAGELRWWHPPAQPSGVGVPVYLSEASPGPAAWSLVGRREVDPLPITYLVWGEGTANEAAPGWSWLSAARVGPMVVPLSGVAEHVRVTLGAIEYVDRMFDDHGNAVVVEERLTGLQGA